MSLNHSQFLTDFGVQRQEDAAPHQEGGWHPLNFVSVTVAGGPFRDRRDFPGRRQGKHCPVAWQREGQSVRAERAENKHGEPMTVVWM